MPEMTVRSRQDFDDRYPAQVPIQVRWGDMDAFGHVNNVHYFRYFESARIVFLESLGLSSQMTSSGIGPILASTKCRYLLPVTYPDELIAGTTISKIEKDRFTMDYALFSTRASRLAAIGNGVVVSYDYETGKKADLPADWLEALDKRS